jgi:hypothetical protein
VQQSPSTSTPAFFNCRIGTLNVFLKQWQYLCSVMHFNPVFDTYTWRYNWIGFVLVVMRFISQNTAIITV